MEPQRFEHSLITGCDLLRNVGYSRLAYESFSLFVASSSDAISEYFVMLNSEFLWLEC